MDQSSRNFQMWFLQAQENLSQSLALQLNTGLSHILARCSQPPLFPSAEFPPLPAHAPQGVDVPIPGSPRGSDQQELE
eukprot:12930942-Prorocentrum_lima.AAC.1